MGLMSRGRLAQSTLRDVPGLRVKRVVQDLYGLADQAMLDMGDFAGGMLKYLKKAPCSTPYDWRRDWKDHQVGAGCDGFTFLTQPSGF